MACSYLANASKRKAQSGAVINIPLQTEGQEAMLCVGTQLWFPQYAIVIQHMCTLSPLVFQSAADDSLTRYGTARERHTTHISFQTIP